MDQEPEEDLELKSKPLGSKGKRKRMDLKYGCSCDFVDRFESRQLKRWIKKFHRRRTKSLRYIG